MSCPEGKTFSLKPKNLNLKQGAQRVSRARRLAFGLRDLPNSVCISSHTAKGSGKKRKSSTTTLENNLAFSNKFEDS